MKQNNRISANLTFAAVCLTVIAVTPASGAETNANEAEAQIVATAPPVQPLAVKMTSPDLRTTTILEALGCTLAEAAKHDRCAR